MRTLWCALAVLCSLLNTAIAQPEGVRIAPESFDQASPGARWKSQVGVTMRFVRDPEGRDHHTLDYTLEHGIRGIWSLDTVPLKPNRRYTINALIRSDFDRADVEVNLGLRHFDPERGLPIPGSREAGVPAKTEGPDGWERWTWSFVTPSIDPIPDAAFTLWVYVNQRPDAPLPLTDGTRVRLDIAELTAVEHPPASRKAYPAGEGVSFRGGPGALPMRIDRVREERDAISVAVTGAEYRFEPRTGTLHARQMIGTRRDLARFDFGDALRGLRIASSDDREAVLISDRLTIGVQFDGVIAITAHDGSPFGMVSTARFRAPFTRFARGHLLAMDDTGGFTVNPLPHVGSGRLPEARAGSEALDFLDFAEIDTESVSDEERGWQIEWTCRPGDRLFLSVFPPRPYDWEGSFSDIWFWTFRESPIASYDTNRPWVTAWALSHSDRSTPIDEDTLRAHVARIHAQGDAAFPYMNAWFHRTRDPKVFVGEVERWMREYAIDGIYSDGLPAVEWLVAYEQMRMLRELVHDGPLVIHDSVPQSGRAISMFQPFLYTYATHTYMGEHVDTRAGTEWAWARYALSQHGAANCFGDIKGDSWNTPEGRFMGTEKDLTNLVFNGRSSPGTLGYVDRYLPALKALEDHWRVHHEDAIDYYNQHHLPLARSLTGVEAGPSGAPIITREGRASGADLVTISTLIPGNVIRYTTDGSTPHEQSMTYTDPFTVDRDATVRAIAYDPGRDPSGVMTSDPSP